MSTSHKADWYADALWDIARRLRALPADLEPDDYFDYEAGELLHGALTHGAFLDGKDALLRDRAERVWQGFRPTGDGPPYGRLWETAVNTLGLRKDDAEPAPAECEAVASLIEEWAANWRAAATEQEATPTDGQLDNKAAGDTESPEPKKRKPDKAETDAKGYVVIPDDPASYLSGSIVLAKHTPRELPLTLKQLSAILDDSGNYIRWTRPRGKNGKPISNRRNVHLGDWVAYCEKQTASDPDKRTIEDRKQVIRKENSLRR